jgi:hypothetical protein
MNLSTDRMIALISAVSRAGGGGLVGPDDADPPPWIAPKAWTFSNPMPSRALLGAQAVISIVTATHAEGARAGGGGRLAEFLDDFCGTPPRPHPHIAATVALLAEFAAVLEEGVYRTRLQETTAMLIERAFAK